MKIKNLLITAGIGLAVGIFVGAKTYKTPSSYSSQVLENLEALADIEITLPEIVIECDFNRQGGKCYTQDWQQGWKMCGEAMFIPCKISGLPEDYCSHPC